MPSNPQGQLHDGKDEERGIDIFRGEREMKTLRLDYDIDCESPNEYDGMWHLYSFERGSEKLPFEMFDENNNMAIGVRRKLACNTAFLLSLYRHSGDRWSFSGNGTRCQFDTVDPAGILVCTYEGKNMKYLPKSLDEREKSAAEFLDLYNTWAEGSCYWWMLEGHHDELIDSCGGYVGTKDGLADMAESINHYLSETDVVSVTGPAAEMADWPLKIKGKLIDAEEGRAQKYAEEDLAYAI
jgi:hypothetical protein